VISIVWHGGRGGKGGDFEPERKTSLLPAGNGAAPPSIAKKGGTRRTPGRYPRGFQEKKALLRIMKEGGERSGLGHRKKKQMDALPFNRKRPSP